MPPPAAVLSPPAAPHTIWNPFSAGAGQVIKWIVSGVTKAINAFFGDLVTSALNPLLKLLGQSLLTTPDVSSLPRIGQLWSNSRDIAVAVYALLILIAGILVMAYETVQTRHSMKEILPRLITAFICANLSLILATQAVSFANALSTAVLGQGVTAHSATATLTALVLGAVTHGGIFLIFIGLGVAGILLALLVGFVIRVAATVILIAGAPLALMCHALPQTEGVARWWWRAFTGVLAIQLCQSLTLIAALNVFLAKGGFAFFGPTGDGLVNLIVTFALLCILFKIPFWILHHIQTGRGRSFIGSAIKGVIAYKTLGMLGLGRSQSHRSGSTRPGGPRPPGAPGSPAARASAGTARHRRPAVAGGARPRPTQSSRGGATARSARPPSHRMPGQGALPFDTPAPRTASSTRSAAPISASGRPRMATPPHPPATKPARPDGGSR